MASDSQTGAGAAVREQRFGWFDRSLAVVVAVSTALIVAAGLVQVSFGPFSMTVVEAWRAVFAREVILNPDAWRAFAFGTELPPMSKESVIAWNMRLPRVLVAIVVGAALAVSGAIFQAVTRNELASPFVLGVSSGAGFAVLLVLVVFSSLAAYLPLFAAFGGAAAFIVVYAIAWKGGTSPVRLVLAGVIVNMVFHSLQMGVFFFVDDVGVARQAIAWTTGSLTGTDWEEVRLAAPWAAISVLLAFAGSRQLNVLLLGEETASSLGMPVERMRFALSGVAILAASAAIAVAGIVSFVGLIVPHVVRTLVGSDYRRLIVGCAFAGPALTVTADVGARLALGSVQMPVGIVTGLLGGPYFLYLMRSQEKLGEL
ncbi:iron ABC transporter permease [Halostella sp. JP-L12]|uniref:FecCD family ABC transporter permease n=1 Tax=Halostella TaxID=1843185 RepID=UPI000EF7934A|nr:MULTISPECIES: iron ABC transporter permease [Halostella]NHN48390.1 iron ABC transporter permease [Halostella sp. JP-L12]